MTRKEKNTEQLLMYQLFSFHQKPMKVLSRLKQISIRKFKDIEEEYLICLGPEKNLVSEGTRDDDLPPKNSKTPNLLKYCFFI